MLFSRKDVYSLINRRFESAWQPVRPAAVVRVDFGNGKTITRTLNGNIATYICTPNGDVLDVIPGIYDPQAYLERLKQGLLLYEWAMQKPGRRPGRRPPRPPVRRPAQASEKVVKNYHTQQAAALRKHKEPKLIVAERRPSIFAIQADMKLVLKSSLRGKPAGRIAAERTTNYTLPRELASRVGRLTPKSLEKDSRYNETIRRVKVHDYLAEHGLVKPADMTKWLYKHVLDTDLDDPYLGLGKVLFSTYPFKDGK